jgi:hypothetical protein
MSAKTSFQALFFTERATALIVAPEFPLSIYKRQEMQTNVVAEVLLRVQSPLDSARADEPLAKNVRFGGEKPHHR